MLIFQDIINASGTLLPCCRVLANCVRIILFPLTEEIVKTPSFKDKFDFPLFRIGVVQNNYDNDRYFYILS